MTIAASENQNAKWRLETQLSRPLACTRTRWTTWSLITGTTTYLRYPISLFRARRDKSTKIRTCVMRASATSCRKRDTNKFAIEFTGGLHGRHIANVLTCRFLATDGAHFQFSTTISRRAKRLRNPRRILSCSGGHSRGGGRWLNSPPPPRREYQLTHFP